jgi:peptidyl-prolyl cis-trans isomerase SurA
MRTILSAIIAVSTGIAAAVTPLSAQQPAPRVDRVGHVVAIVGDSAILNFDVQQAVNAWEAQRGETLPPSGPLRDQVVAQILEERISELLIVQAALRDTLIRVSDEQINQRVQQEIDQRQRAVGGPAQFDEALRASGMTPQSFREMLFQQERRRQLIQQFVGRAMSARQPPPVTDREMREAFEARRDELDERPATITYQQVYVPTRPSPEALAQTRARADSVFEMVRNREDFETLARRFGQDGTRERGGDLGWGRRSDWDRDFANVAFSLRPGEVSQPVLTQFGYHLIKVERVRGAEVHARHILFRPEVTVQDAGRALARADTVAERMRAGADVPTLARQYGDRDAPVRQGPSPIDLASRQVGMDLSEAETGTVLGPLPVGGDDVADAFVVIRIAEREPARPWTLDDQQLREQMRRDLQQQKLFEEIVAELRRRSHVEIRTL